LCRQGLSDDSRKKDQEHGRASIFGQHRDVDQPGSVS
jgi:hypothetical protein